MDGHQLEADDPGGGRPGHVQPPASDPVHGDHPARGRPPEVVAANDDWMSENDQLGRFIEECCVVADSFSGRARPLYERYRQWAEGAGENAITETLFGRRLKDKGFAKEHRRYGSVYSGIALRAEESGSA